MLSDTGFVLLWLGLCTAISLALPDHMRWLMFPVPVVLFFVMARYVV